MTKRFGSNLALDDVSFDLRPGSCSRSSRRERRRQEHARQVHHGLLSARRRQALDRGPGGRGPESARRPAPRYRHGLPALHAGREHDASPENLVLSRARRARDHRLKRELKAIDEFMQTHAVPGATGAHRAAARGGREAEARDPEAALPRQPYRDFGRADQRAHSRRRPTRCSACCGGWPRTAESASPSSPTSSVRSPSTPTT